MSFLSRLEICISGLPLVQGRLGVCPGVDRRDGGVVGIAGNGHRLPVQTDLEGIGPELCGNADVPRCFGTDLGGVRIEVADIRLVGLLTELDFGKAEGVCFARNFCDDRIIRGGVRKFCTEDPLCGLRDCCLNEICCHIVSYSIASRSLKVAETRSKSIDLRFYRSRHNFERVLSVYSIAMVFYLDIGRVFFGVCRPLLLYWRGNEI